MGYNQPGIFEVRAESTGLWSTEQDLLAAVVQAQAAQWKLNANIYVYDEEGRKRAHVGRSNAWVTDNQGEVLLEVQGSNRLTEKDGSGQPHLPNGWGDDA